MTTSQQGHFVLADILHINSYFLKYLYTAYIPQL